jgi:hypothetical protein
MNMNNEIHDLAEHALALSNNDIVRAVEILRELTGLSFDTAFMLIDEVALIDEAQPSAKYSEDPEPL